MNLRDVAVEAKDLPLGLILEPELPSRETMDERKLDELADNIRVNGLLQPLIVVRVGERFEVIAGHRRTLAAKRAGLVVVPSRIYPDKTAALEAAKYAENRFREDLNPAEEAIYFAQLCERDCGDDVDKLCAQLGEKRSYVEGRLNLLRGDETILDALKAGKIGVGVAQELNRCGVPQYRRYLLHQAIVGGATQSIVRGWIQDWQRGQDARGDQPAAPPPSSMPTAIPSTNFFICACCLGGENVHTMVPVNFHSACWDAIVSKLLASYRG